MMTSRNSSLVNQRFLSTISLSIKGTIAKPPPKVKVPILAKVQNISVFSDIVFLL